MERIPFTSYDFWAYLSAGLLLLVACDYVAGAGLLSRESWTVMQGSVAAMASYISGHLTATLSAALFEGVLVRRVLGLPRNILFGRAPAARLWKVLFPGYYRALPEETRQAVLRRAKEKGVQGPGEALFWVAYANARQTPEVTTRLENFLNQYGFARNIATVSIIISIMLLTTRFAFAAPPVNGALAAIALVVTVGMTLRYLKFFRLFAVEVFTSYAYCKD